MSLINRSRYKDQFGSVIQHSSGSGLTEFLQYELSISISRVVVDSGL